MKKENMDPNRALKTTNILFYGGLVLAFLGIAIGAGTNHVPVMLIIAVVSLAGMFGGILFAYARVRCPHCYGSLMWGGRVPMSLPTYCPHCGKRL